MRAGTSLILMRSLRQKRHPEICEARVGSSRHAAWFLHVIRFDLDALPANPRNRRAIIIGGSIATHLELLEAGQMRRRYRRHWRYRLQALEPGNRRLRRSRQLVSTGVLYRKASSSICLTRKSATLARDMKPHVQSRGSTSTR